MIHKNITISHGQVKKIWGKADVCENCGSTTKVEWSNKTHEYLNDRNNWQKLCSKCHQHYDSVNYDKVKNMKMEKFFKENNLPTFLRPIDIAIALGVGRATVWRYIKQGKLKSRRFSTRMVRISLDDFNTFLETEGIGITKGGEI